MTLRRSCPSLVWAFSSVEQNFTLSGKRTIHPICRRGCGYVLHLQHPHCQSRSFFFLPWEGETSDCSFFWGVSCPQSVFWWGNEVDVPWRAVGPSKGTSQGRRLPGEVILEGTPSISAWSWLAPQLSP